MALEKHGSFWDEKENGRSCAVCGWSKLVVKSLAHSTISDLVVVLDAALLETLDHAKNELTAYAEVNQFLYGKGVRSARLS